MIRGVDITNFQAHRRLRVLFRPGVNAIIGPTDRGKSAILRAIRWVVENRPRGDAFRTYGTDRTVVEVRLSTGRSVTREKGEWNGYTLDGGRFAAVGADVPAEVAGLFGFSEFNWQGQHDPPFLLSATPGEVARTLNGLVDLECIDGIQQTLQGHQRRARSEAAMASAQADAGKILIEALTPALEIAGRVTSLAEAEREAVALRHRASRLRAALEEAEKRAVLAREAAERVRVLAPVAALAKRVEKGLENGKAAQALRDKARALRSLADAAEKASQETVYMEQELAELTAELDRATPDTCPLCGGKMRRRKDGKAAAKA